MANTSPKTKLLLGALAVFVILAMLTKYWLDSELEQARPRDFVSVFRVKNKGAIPAGTVITRALVEQIRVPRNYAPVSAVRPDQLAAIEGLKTNVDIQSGDYLLDTYFDSHSSSGKKLSEQVSGENSARAVTIPVDEINSLSRSIVAGDRIDIVFTFNPPNSAHKMSTMFMQNVLVLTTGSYSAADQDMGGSSGNAKRYATITLLLNVRDAIRLNYARQAGQINVLLRSNSDTSVVDVSAVTSVKDLLSAGDRTVVEETLKKDAPSPEMADKLREQFKEIIEAQRSQTKR